MSLSTETLCLADLRSQFEGRLLGPDDEGYDDARVIALGGVDSRPAVIVRPVVDADVARRSQRRGTQHRRRRLLAADVATADGQLLRVDEGSHPDLFWAIRGGGGNYGVVTRFQFRLHEVDQVLGGMLVLPATRNDRRGIHRRCRRCTR